MVITLDPAKDGVNQAKHAVSLALAAELEWESAVTWPDLRRAYGEPRQCALALLGERLFFVAFVDRADGISLRKANDREKCTMPKYLTTKSGRKVLLNTPEEDAAITAAALSDPDALPLTGAEWEAAKPLARIGRPPKTAPKKVPTTIRFDADVLDALKASGKGWQTRVNEAVREWIKAHPGG